MSPSADFKKPSKENKTTVLSQFFLFRSGGPSNVHKTQLNNLTFCLSESRGQRKFAHRKTKSEKRKKKEKKSRRAETEREREMEEVRKGEEEKRLKLEHELRLRRAELYEYRFGTKTRLDSFRSLPIDDVTQLRIGVFGATGSGKRSFINTCERAVRETKKSSVLDSTTVKESTITLQDYLPEMFFRLVDVRGFFIFTANEVVQFRNILEGKFQTGDNVTRPLDQEGQGNASVMGTSPAFANQLHGVILVVKANGPWLGDRRFKNYLRPVRDILRLKGNV